MINHWIEAMRLRTLPVSIAGVIVATSYSIVDQSFNWLPTLLCLLFALLAQVASNFANEYYDYRDGLDKAGRVGPRRGVTEGDITPRAMLIATLSTLAAACLVGCCLIYWGGWWMVPIGLMIAVGVIAYSAGPYPLSRNGLGEVAVVFFFGIIPVNFTYYLQSLHFDASVALGSIAIGLMGANVLIVNNYRDADDDRLVGKRTLAVIFGRSFASRLYLINGLMAMVLMIPTVMKLPWLAVAVLAYMALHLRLWKSLTTLTRQALNPLLGKTAKAMLAYAMLFVVIAIIATVV